MYLPPLRQFYRAAESVVTLSREVWNRLCQTVEDHHKAIIANRIVAFQGGTISEGPTGTILRVDALGGPQSFQVTGHPNASGGVVAPYVYAVTYNNGSTGTSNTSIAVVAPHSVGELLVAEPIPSTYWKDVLLQDADGNTIVWKESGSYRSTHLTMCNQSGGSAGGYNSGSGHLEFCTFTYNILSPDGTRVLSTNVSLDTPGQRIAPVAMTAATFCLVYVAQPGSTDITWRIVTAFEQADGDYCYNSGGG